MRTGSQRPPRGSVGDGAADLRNLSREHESREVHTWWRERARNTRPRPALPAVDSPARSDRRRRTAAETELTLPGGVHIWDFRRWRGITTHGGHTTRALLQTAQRRRKRGSGVGCGLERHLPRRNPRKRTCRAPSWSGVQILTLETERNGNKIPPRFVLLFVLKTLLCH